MNRPNPALVLVFWFIPSLLAFTSLVLHCRTDSTVSGGIDWQAVAAVATSFSMLVTFGVLLVSLNALAQSRDSNKTELTLKLFREMDEDRENRARIFELNEAIFDSPNGWGPEQLKSANNVAARLNVAGLLIKHDKIETEMFLDEWKATIDRLAPRLQHFVAEQRQNRGNIWNSLDSLFDASGRHVSGSKSSQT